MGFGESPQVALHLMPMYPALSQLEGRLRSRGSRDLPAVLLHYLNLVPICLLVCNVLQAKDPSRPPNSAPRLITTTGYYCTLGQRHGLILC